ncbi:MAG: C39 family peptidase [Phycisphaerae bacterium]|nr:C39 family peptidase [Phycisphaerae bacterium]
MRRPYLLPHAAIAAFCIGLMLPLLAGTPSTNDAPALTAAAGKARPTSRTFKSARIDGVPHVRQQPDFCGEACVAMALGWLKEAHVSQNDVFAASGLDPVEGRGCCASDLLNALLTLGFKPGSKAECWQRINADNAEAELQDRFAELHADLRAGHPSIVCMHYDDSPETTEHVRLIVGYDSDGDEVLYHEPAEDDAAYRRMPRKQFLKLWPLKYKPREWTAIRFRLKPGDLDLPEPARPRRRTLIVDGREKQVPVVAFSAADYAQHVRRLRHRYPMDDMTVLIEEPFVVVGDESPATVRRYAEQTIRWATRHYRKDYFASDPSRIITIWLLGDKDSYATISRAVSGRAPGTPFGFYLESRDALIMNISTGGGTLVHEMFHAFVPANFPSMPPWLNEGMASLYEQCGERGGRMVGFTNWRLAGLKTAIANKATLRWKDLCDLDIRGFYGPGSGVHYAQARYLCYYLQQKRLLRKFYQAFLAGQAKDPTGYHTLLKVLDVDDPDALLRDWQAWVLALKFPA